jgi:hypothetical protein
MKRGQEMTRKERLSVAGFSKTARLKKGSRRTIHRFSGQISLSFSKKG